MKPANVIARLLLAYWVIVGFANIIFFRGFGLRSVGELLLYVAVGVGCYYATMTIARLASRRRKQVHQHQHNHHTRASRRWSS